MFSSVPAIIRAPIIFEKLVSPLWCFEMRQVCMWHSYKDQNGFYCKLFNLFPSPGSSVLHDSYQPKGTHLSGWSSADYPESYLAILGKYNILTSCICIRLSNASLQHNVLPSTKINSERASCCAMGKRGFSSSYLFLKYLDLVNIYRKKKIRRKCTSSPGSPWQSGACQQYGVQSLDVSAGCAEGPPPTLGSLVSKDGAGTWAGDKALAHCVWVCLPGTVVRA